MSNTRPRCWREDRRFGTFLLLALCHFSRTRTHTRSSRFSRKTRSRPRPFFFPYVSPSPSPTSSATIRPMHPPHIRTHTHAFVFYPILRSRHKTEEAEGARKGGVILRHTSAKNE